MRLPYPILSRLVHLLPAVALLATPAFAAAPPVRTAEEIRASLDRIRREAEENRKKLRRTEARERSVVAQLDSLDREAGIARSYLAQLDSEAVRLEGEMRGADAALEALTGRLSDRQVGFARRLRDIYKRSRGIQGLQVLLSADSFAELMRRSRYLSAVARQDREDYEAILRDRDALAAARARLSAQRETFDAVRREKEAQVTALGARTRARRKLLTEVRRSVKTYQAAEAQFARERERSEAALLRLIAGAEKERTRQRGEGEVASEAPSGAFSGLRGRLPWPVRGPVVGRFGRVQDPALKTWTFNRGIEIEVAEGVPARAVAAGRVEAVDWFRGYGWFALVGHGEGYYTLYAHLSGTAVRVGDRVDAGEAVGASGDTGTLDGRPRLHFEVLRGSEPEDPLAWLTR